MRWMLRLPGRNLLVALLFWAGIVGMVFVVVDVLVLHNKIDAALVAVFGAWCLLPVTVTLDQKASDKPAMNPGHANPRKKKRKHRPDHNPGNPNDMFAAYPLTWALVAVMTTLTLAFLLLGVKI